MKTLTKIAFILLVFVAFGCKQKDLNKQDNTEEQVEFKFNEPDFSSGVMTPEILWSMGRIGETELSPDGTKVIYALSYYSIEQNKSKREIYLIDLADNTTKQLTDNNFNEYSPVWRADGEKIAFLAASEGIMQIWEMNPDGTDAKPVTNEDSDISNFAYSPANNRILFTKDVKIKDNVQDIYPDLPDANALIITDLLFRHWDVWEDEYFSHVFFADYDSKNSTVSNVTDIMPDEAFDTPTKPFGGIEEITFSPDGNSIAYTCKKLEGKAYAISTNSDIYLYDIVSGKTTNLSSGNMGYDKSPVFSEKGDKIAWESMARDGFEADKNRIFVYDFTSNEIKNYSENFDQNAFGLTWFDNDSKIYFISGIKATEQIFSVDLSTNEFNQITKGVHNYTSFSLSDGFAVANKMSMSSPVEIYKVDLTNGTETQLSFVNKEMLDKITLKNVGLKQQTVKKC